ncbi:GAF domain-containing protein [Actinomadura sp. NPDC048955]|uniref:GAF domain-containing protein n=1 Tax=Actinomadura sp. NPDC048955 TaxID=3158228 RepID=UPI0033DAB45E
MRYDDESGLPINNWHDTAEQRKKLLTEIGLDGSPLPELDRLATEVSFRFAARLGSPGEGLYSMVNLFLPREQTFAGLHNPPGARPAPRTMPPDHGFCPEMLDRTKALVLDNVFRKPQFRSNPVVDRLGIHTYAGAPLTLGPDHTVVGSVCVVGTNPMPKETRQTSLTLIKQARDDLLELLARRASPGGGRHSASYRTG